MHFFSQALITGIFATVVMDIWLLILNRAFKIPTTNWAMVGRWLGHLPQGVFLHHPISDSRKIWHENTLGWVFHYLVGFLYAFIYLSLVLSTANEPSLLSATVFGILTVVIPWFILQPGLGLGLFASKAPKPNLTRLINLSVHSIFGASLYLGWIIVVQIEQSLV